MPFFFHIIAKALGLTDNNYNTGPIKRIEQKPYYSSVYDPLSLSPAELISLNKQYAALKSGTKVIHPTFGVGYIKSISGANEMLQAEVKFTKDTKILMLRFAKLKIIE